MYELLEEIQIKLESTLFHSRLAFNPNNLFYNYDEFFTAYYQNTRLIEEFIMILKNPTTNEYVLP